MSDWIIDAAILAAAAVAVGYGLVVLRKAEILLSDAEETYEDAKVVFEVAEQMLASAHLSSKGNKE